MSDWFTSNGMCVSVPGNPTRGTFDCTYYHGFGRKKLTRLGVREIRIVIDQIRRDGVGQRTIQYVHATLRAASNTPTARN
jgi:hypothetical protein